MLMKTHEKNSYEVPVTEVIVFKTEGYILGGTTETPGEDPIIDE